MQLQSTNSPVLYLSELGQYAPGPTAPGLPYELGSSGMSYTPAGYQRAGSPSPGYQRSGSPSPSYQRSGSPSLGYQRSGSPSAGYQPTGYQSATYQPGGYQSAGSSDYPSLYPALPVSGPVTYPGGSQYPARTHSPMRAGLAGPVPYPGGSEYPGPSPMYDGSIGPSSMPTMNSAEMVC
jgi:hypothetical protein